MDPPAIGDLEHQLRQLSRLDRTRRIQAYRVVGADRHRYRTKRVKAADVERLEAVLGGYLPEDFRQHLLTVGSGAGPYDGIFSAAAMLDTMKGLDVEADELRLPRPRPNQPFPLTADDARAVAGEVRGIERSVMLDGCLAIAEQEISTEPFWAYSVLVICGAERGTVWDLRWPYDDEGREWFEWFPARVPPGVPGETEPTLTLPCPPGFLDWYRAWATNAAYGLSGSAPSRRA